MSKLSAQAAQTCLNELSITSANGDRCNLHHIVESAHVESNIYGGHMRTNMSSKTDNKGEYRCQIDTQLGEQNAVMYSFARLSSSR